MSTRPDACTVCHGHKGKRLCPRRDGARICSLCCGETRSWQQCPVDCAHFPEDPDPGYAMPEITFGPVVEGDVTRFQQILYLPNLYEHIFCNVESVRFTYQSAQAVELQVCFRLQKLFRTATAKLDSRDSWRTKDYPESAQGQRLLPLIGIVAIGRGLVVPGSVRISPPLQHDVVAGRWIVVAPHGRSLPDPVAMGGGKSPRPVTLLQVRNEMLFGELLFERQYVLHALLLNPSELMADGTLGSRLGVLLPYGRVQVAPTQVLTPGNISASSIKLGMLTARPTDLYPGESADGRQTEFLPQRGNEERLCAHVSAEVEVLGDEKLCAVISEGPCAAVAATRLAAHDSLVVSLLRHDDSVNARLLPVLTQWLGPMASPLHVDIFNLSGSVQKVKVRETNQRTGCTRVEIASIPAGGEGVIPLALPGADAESPGEMPLHIEVLIDTAVIFEETAAITLLPSDCLLLRVEDEARDWYRNTDDAVACWVTPDDAAVVEWIANTRHNAGVPMGAACQTVINTQIKALWQELERSGGGFQSRSYIADVSASRTYQHVTIPSETLRLRSGNCIDYTVLFASALERLGLKPVIILKPGHAFLAWENADSGVDGGLETTLLGLASAADALARGSTQLQEIADRLDARPGYRAVKIAQARQMGLSPIF